jgi:methionyl-tRNA synthetase
VDAPVGYLASFQELCEREGLDFEAWWQPGSPAEVYHFIGKDIIYFHVLFWPAMLHFAGRRTPENVHVHGFVTVSGAKMSKSRGTGISPLRYLELGLHPDWLRYYLAAKLNGRVEDVDFTPEDFIARINSDLVGKLVNIASRCSGFLVKRFDGLLGEPDADALASFSRAWPGTDAIAGFYETRETSRAVRGIMQLADAVNQYIDAHKPWELAKQPEQTETLHRVLSTAMCGYADLVRLLLPVIPVTATAALEQLGLQHPSWEDIGRPLPTGHRVSAYKHLMKRTDEKQLAALFDAPEPPAVADQTPPPAAGNPEPLAPEIAIEDFTRVDLRVARITAAERVEGSKKLLRLTLDVGEAEARTVFSGIQAAYEPEALVGRLTVVVANLAPRKMRFGLSQGMVLAASGESVPGLFLLSPDSGATPGMRVS